MTGQLKLLSWNIAHSSLARAHKIADWLEKREENIIILTETADASGSVFIHDRLESFGYRVIFPKVKSDYGTMLAFKQWKGF
jgi:exonuclease III